MNFFVRYNGENIIAQLISLLLAINCYLDYSLGILCVP